MGENPADRDLLPDREKARVSSRDRKVRGPKVVVDNVGVKKAALRQAQKAAEERRRREGGS